MELSDDTLDRAVHSQCNGWRSAVLFAAQTCLRKSAERKSRCLLDMA